MKADLHMHTTLSDGRLTNIELFERASKKDVDIISITDHDVCLKVEENFELAKEYGIKYIPGIELSTTYMDKPVHVLGYFTDESYKDEKLIELYKVIKEKREIRAKKMIYLLKEHFGIEISYDKVKSHTRGIIARPHIASAILEQLPQLTFNDVFEQYIGNDSKAYLPSVDLGVQEGIDLLRQYHCVVVLAHPVLLKPQIKEYVLSLKFDGIEARYFQNKSGDEEFYRNYAKERNMFVTAGSDYHGIEDDPKHGDVGDITIDGEDLNIFLKQFS